MDVVLKYASPPFKNKSYNVENGNKIGLGTSFLDHLTEKGQVRISSFLGIHHPSILINVVTPSFSDRLLNQIEPSFTMGFQLNLIKAAMKKITATPDTIKIRFLHLLPINK